ncbi:MAG: Ribosomal protein L1 [Candidatus Methanohalarchaeum thermophilum]|uniref:Large ribosomal subunit protein uL1 n=1 Tax=Methanohalarchaeum thermophilum TaxID=1903181 RepID=A0A1Q6DT98_METT1|nr:MAG: Ribosomal protein L1 [Candidatus Methanohalarchaeum thermophilum]
MLPEQEIEEKVKDALDSAEERNFEESVDLAINLKNIDLSDPNNRVDREVTLPNGRGKGVKVCVFGSGDLAREAEDVADFLLSPEELEDLGDDKQKARSLAKECDFFLAEAPLMPDIGRILGPILGPRGKMPDPVQPGEDIVPKIKRLKETIRLRSGEEKTFHALVGSIGQELEEIVGNLNTILRRLERELPMGRQNIDSIYVKTTMGPSVRLM